MQLYRFSPIKKQNELIEAVIYVASQTTTLSKKVLAEELPITSLTIFSHYLDEYQTLTTILDELGNPYDENNGPRITLNNPILVGNNTIIQLRIRKPDPYRMQVGCNDFEIEDYEAFKAKYLTTFPQNLRLIVRPDYEMIELFDPDFDVLAYFLSR